MRVYFAGLAAVILLFSLIACSRSPEEKQARYLASGRSFVAQKDYARAILEFKNAIEAKPNAPEAYYEIGLAYLATGDWQQAAVNLKRATDLNPGHAGAQIKISQLMAASGDQALLEEARKRLEGVFQTSPDDVEAMTALAITEWKLAKPEEAEKYLRRAFEKAPQNLGSSVALARLKAEQKQFEEAEKILKQAVGEPPSAGILVALGEFYYQRNRPSEAAEQFERALRADPKHAPALLDLAAMAVRAGDTAKAEQIYKRISELPDKQYRPMHAVYLFQSGKRDLAIAELRGLYQKAPEDRTVRDHLLAALIWSDRTPEAERLLSEAVKKNPGDVDALLQRAGLYLTLRRYGEAETDLSKALPARPDSAETHYLFSKIREARGQILTQRQELDEALRLKPELLPARLELAALLIRTNRAKIALDVLDRTPEEQKKLAPVAIQRGWALLAMRKTDELEQALKGDLGHLDTPEVHVLSAALRLAQNRMAEARRLAQQALAKNPEDLRALEILARGYAEEKNLPEAVRQVAVYAGQRPKSAPLQQFLGSLLLASGDRAKARAAFSRSRAVDPAFLPARLGLVQIDIAEGKWNEAKTSLVQIVSEYGDNLVARLWLGDLEEKAGNAAAAIEQYQRVVARDQDNIMALNNLAFLLADSAGKPDEALKYAEKAVELAPSNPAVVNTLGWVLYQKGLYELAVKRLSEAVKLEGTARRNLHLGMAYLKHGDRNNARAALDTALKLSPPGAPEARQAKELMAILN